MKRRLVIKNLLIIAGGIAILPSCSEKPGTASIQLVNLDVNADQENLLAEIAETIIPHTNGPGAKDLKLHLFVLKMVDDCHSAEDQERFIHGLNNINKFAQTKLNRSFQDASVAQRAQLLQTIENAKDTDQNIRSFYSITKNRTIQGFLNSKYVMTDLKQYELVPGRYNGYFHVKQATKAS